MAVNKTVLITDLDNTLFDWVDLWVNCFSVMLDGIADMSGIPKEELKPEISAIHQKYGRNTGKHISGLNISFYRK
jgi:phosphoglycolate phosphatase